MHGFELVEKFIHFAPFSSFQSCSKIFAESTHTQLCRHSMRTTICPTHCRRPWTGPDHIICLLPDCLVPLSQLSLALWVEATGPLARDHAVRCWLNGGHSTGLDSWFCLARRSKHCESSVNDLFNWFEDSLLGRLCNVKLKISKVKNRM